MSGIRTPGRMRKRWLLLLLAVIAVLYVRSDWIGRMIYPLSHTEEIKQYAEKYDLDPLLIAAIIRVESNYREDAVSPKGAVGIMQLMPETAAWILTKGKFDGITVEDAGTKAEAGIHLGAWYVRELSRQFDGNLTAMLAAYNAGPTRVRQWMDDQIWDGRFDTIHRIPYGETRQYVRRVMYYYKKYSEIYDTL